MTGYSYGGYMTNTVITRTTASRRLRPAPGTASSSANYGHDIYQKWYNWELGVPWENREKYDRLSPLLQAGQVTTPTIFLGGRDDWNVPVLNAELFYQSLRQARHRDAARRLSRHAPRRLDRRSSTRTTC